MCTSFFIDLGEVEEDNVAPFYEDGSLQPFSVDVEQEFTFFYPQPQDDNPTDTVTVLVEPLGAAADFITVGTDSLFVAPIDNSQAGTY